MLCKKIVSFFNSKFEAKNQLFIYFFKKIVSPQHQNQKGSFLNINALVSVILIYITSIYINIYYIDALFYID